MLLFLPAILGFATIYLLLPRPRPYPRLWGAAAGVAALLSLGLVLRGTWTAHTTPEVVESALFGLFASVALAAGTLLLSQRNPVRAALSFALVVLSTCGLFLLQAAPFLMAATIIVYAGAIIVTFLFVIMLAQQAGLSDADQRSREPFLSCLAGFVLLGAILFVLHQGFETRSQPAFEPARFDALLGRIDQARHQATAAEMATTLGDDAAFFEEFRHAVQSARGAPRGALLAARAREVEAEWKVWRTNGRTADMKEALEDLAALGTFVRASRTAEGQARLPAANTASLGVTLFTEYLLPVELGGTLLLVATIGAILITGRREALR